MFRVTLALICALIVVPFISRVSVAAPINGYLQMPTKFKAGSRHKIRGFCERQSNEVRSIQPPLMDPRAEMLVVLVGNGLPASTDKPVLIMEDARFKPPVVAARPGQQINFRNKDSTVHILEPGSKDKAKQFMKPMRIQSGSETMHAFAAAGEYKLRCSEVPHMNAAVIIKEKALFQVPDATGAFRFTDVPPGTYTMSIWYRGRWIAKQSLKVGRAKVNMKVSLKKLGKD